MGERRTSVDKKNHSRVEASSLSRVSSIQKRSYSKKTGTKKYEVTCIKCRFTKMWTQKMWDLHQWKVHNIRNEIHIGPTLFPISTG